MMCIDSIAPTKNQKEIIMCYIVRKVATTGCEILDENGVVVAWSVDEEWGEKIVRGLDSVEEKELEEVEA